jgi:hypothetical protein
MTHSLCALEIHQQVVEKFLLHGVRLQAASLLRLSGTSRLVCRRGARSTR